MNGRGLCSELLEPIRVRQRPAHRTGKDVRRELGAAVTPRRHHAGSEVDSLPTRNGPSTCRRGTAVIFHACCIPKKMMAPLMRPDGIEPKTTTIGNARMNPSVMRTPRI